MNQPSDRLEMLETKFRELWEKYVKKLESLEVLLEEIGEERQKLSLLNDEIEKEKELLKTNETKEEDQ